MTCYRKHLSRGTALLILKKILHKNRNKKKKWTKSWFVRGKSTFTTICKELTVKLYTKDIKNYIRMQSNFTLQILLSTSMVCLKSGNKL